MKKILEYLFNYNKLNYDQAKEILIDITSNKYSHSEIASFMTIYKMRNPSIFVVLGAMEKTRSTYQRSLLLL